MASDTGALAAALVEWFVEHGGWISPEVRVVHSPSHGFHVQAAEQLTSSRIVTCPLKLTLSALNVDPQQKEVLPIDSSLRHCQGQVPDHILAYLLLCEQRIKGKASPWHTYVSCLPEPESMTTPLWFDDEDLAYLTGTNLARAAQDRKTELHAQWTRALEIVKLADTALGEAIDLTTFLWAATIFTSRAFVSKHILPNHSNSPILFPVLDLLNHSATAKVEWDFQPHSSFTLKILDTETVVPGDELFNNYAPKQNDELLLGYGFSLEDNPIEQFALKLAFPPFLQQYASEAGLLNPSAVPFGMDTTFLTADPSTAQHFLRPPHHPFGQYTNRVRNLRAVPPAVVHTFYVQALMTSETDPSQIRDPARPDLRLTLAVLATALQALDAKRRAFPSDALDSSPSNEKQRYAKIYRDGQIRILDAVLAELQAALDPFRVAPDPRQLPRAPLLLDTTTATTVLRTAFPDAGAHFDAGIAALLSPGHTTPLDTDRTTWTAWLITALSLTLTHPPPPPPAHPLLADWLRDLLTRHRLPALADGIDDPDIWALVTAHLDSFLRLGHRADDDDVDPIHVLDAWGLRAASARAPDQLVARPVRELGTRVLMWGVLVAGREMLGVRERGEVRGCVVVRPWRGAGEVWEVEEMLYGEDGEEGGE